MTTDHQDTKRPCTVTVHPYNRALPFSQGQTVYDILQKAGLGIDSPCGGHGECGQCLVQVEAPQDIPETPHKALTAEQAEQGFRLACQLKPGTDMTIRIPHGVRIKQAPTAGRLLEPDLYLPPRHINPAVRTRRAEAGLELLYHGEAEIYSCPGTQEDPALYGLAIDIGTTTLSASLVSLHSGAELAVASSLNPQISFGHDVLTRIRQASEADQLKDLVHCIRSALNSLINDLCSRAGIVASQINDIVLGGNTTMLQICGDIDPSPLGRLPFRVDLGGGKSCPADAFGFRAHPWARVYIPPIRHAFIGSDISAGLSITRDFFREKKPHLYIDIGTNGEMALSIGETKIVTSTAAGPAFEGAGLLCGMRAADGAIERVSTENQDIAAVVIGEDHKPRGICGSGLIDLLQVLVDIGVVDHSGRMKKAGEDASFPPRIASRLLERNGKPAFGLSDGVIISQSDVRQLQLAKAAIRTGIECLLQEAEISAADIERISIAGGFGRSLRPESLEAIGLVPPGTSQKISFVGNTSRLGCIRLLLDVDLRAELEENMNSVAYLAIAELPEFMTQFLKHIPFPD